MRILILLSFILSAPFSYASQYYGGVGGGLSSLSSGSDTETGKNGYHFLGDLSDEFNSKLGYFTIGLGLKYVSLAGDSNRFVQQTDVLNPTLGFGWSYPLWRGLEAGMLLQNFVGPGAYAEYPAGSAVQWLMSCGPEIRYRFSLTEKMDMIVGAAYLVSVNDPVGTRADIPLTVKIQIPWGKKREESHEPDPTPVQVQEIGTSAMAQFVLPDTVRIIIPASLLNFEKGKAELGEAGVNYLEGVARLIGGRTYEKIETIGHTDRRGTAELNKWLSLARAQSVTSQLVKSGINREKIKASGKGSSEPLDPAETEEAYKKNRRVEIQINQLENPQEFIRALNQLNPTHPLSEP